MLFQTPRPKGTLDNPLDGDFSFSALSSALFAQPMVYEFVQQKRFFVGIPGLPTIPCTSIWPTPQFLI